MYFEALYTYVNLSVSQNAEWVNLEIGKGPVPSDYKFTALNIQFQYNYCQISNRLLLAVFPFYNTLFTFSRTLFYAIRGYSCSLFVSKLIEELHLVAIHVTLKQPH